MLSLLRRAVDEYGQTMVMVSHDASAAAVADAVLFLADGRIVDRQEARRSTTSSTTSGRWRDQAGAARDGGAPAPLGADRDRGAPRSGDDRGHLRPHGRDPDRVQRDQRDRQPRAPTRCSARRRSSRAPFSPGASSSRSRWSAGAGLPEVAKAAGALQAFGSLVVDGKLVEYGGASRVCSAPARSRSTRPSRSEGRDPAAPGEIAVSRDLADDTGSRSATASGSRPPTGPSGSPLWGWSTSATPAPRPATASRWRPRATSSAGTTSAGRSVRSRSPPSRGCHRSSSSARSRRSCPPSVKVQTGQQNADEHSEADLQLDQLVPRAGAAGLRRCGAAGRRVHHLQHLLDLGRRANAGVRLPADARGDARAGASIGGDRGARDRGDRVGRRTLRRSSHSPRGSARSSRPPARGYRRAT